MFVDHHSLLSRDSTNIIMFCKMLVVFMINCFLVMECLCISERFKRQASPDDEYDECQPPFSQPSGQGPPKPPPQCCDILKLETKLHESYAACEDKKPTPPTRGQSPPPGPRRHGPPDDIGCYVECVFNASKLLTEDNKINKKILLKYGNSTATSNPEWSVALQNVPKCLEDSVFNETDAHKCKSGSVEFYTCLSKQLFLNCPESLWTSSDECTKMKTIVEKCPHVPPPIFMRIGGPPQPPSPPSSLH